MSSNKIRAHFCFVEILERIFGIILVIVNYFLYVIKLLRIIKRSEISNSKKNRTIGISNIYRIVLDFITIKHVIFKNI